MEKGGKKYVLEASRVVKLTPLKDWIAQGRSGAVKMRRILDKPIKIQYKQYLGQPYDLAFKFDNGKMYCSELIYVIYRDQFGIEIGKPKQVKEYNLFGSERLMKKRGISEDQLVIAPSDIL